VLTDAFGCSQCQQICVIRADGYVLEQISSIYPYRQHWYWTGHTWKLLRPPFCQSKVAWAVGALAVVIALFFCLTFAAKVPLVPHHMVWMVLLFFVFIFFMAWLILYQRS
jgi:glucose-6-phosphate-specific signal transduction histidine kinase